ncbi:Snf7-domain-containing protein [Testicularia cyperi]|uniref:Snf7-domain-containing protein n=1 Tax=Testicularia cyperi TaxID=1882483 RepID=A0A317XP36_9BASI|nr:Snf7-domain-containing protein [Testicularia cyperi]
MSGLEKSLFQLKFTAKSLQRQARKASKDETAEKAKLKKALAQGNTEGARIYASNAIRKKNESLNLLRLGSRIDAVASRVETAVTMRQVTGSMASVVKGMDKAMESMNLERISMVMDKFESQFEDMDVQTSYMEGTIGATTAQTMPQDQVDLLMQQVADENGIEINHKLGEGGLLEGKVADLAPKVPESSVKNKEREDDALAERLRALRPATIRSIVTIPPPRHLKRLSLCSPTLPNHPLLSPRDSAFSFNNGAVSPGPTQDQAGTSASPDSSFENDPIGSKAQQSIANEPSSSTSTSNGQSPLASTASSSSDPTGSQDIRLQRAKRAVHHIRNFSTQSTASFASHASSTRRVASQTVEEEARTGTQPLSPPASQLQLLSDSPTESRASAKSTKGDRSGAMSGLSDSPTRSRRGSHSDSGSVYGAGQDPSASMLSVPDPVDMDEIENSVRQSKTIEDFTNIITEFRLNRQTLYQDGHHRSQGSNGNSDAADPSSSRHNHLRSTSNSNSVHAAGPLSPSQSRQSLDQRSEADETPRCTCCCSKDDCPTALRARQEWRDLEADLRLSAEIGQALLRRHDAMQAKLQKQAEEYMQQRDGLMSRLTKSYKETSALERELAQSNLNLEAGDSSNRALLHELDDVRGQLSKLRASTAKLTGADERLKGVSRELEDLKQELAAERKRASAAETRCKKLEVKSSQLADSLKHARKEADIASRRTSRIDLSEDAMQSARERLTRGLRHQRNASLGADSIMSTEDEAETAKALDSLVQDNQALRQDNDKLRSLLDACNEELASLRQAKEEDVVLLRSPMMPESDSVSPGEGPAQSQAIIRASTLSQTQSKVVAAQDESDLVKTTLSDELGEASSQTRPIDVTGEAPFASPASPPRRSEIRPAAGSPFAMPHASPSTAESRPSITRSGSIAYTVDSSSAASQAPESLSFVESSRSSQTSRDTERATSDFLQSDPSRRDNRTAQLSNLLDYINRLFTRLSTADVDTLSRRLQRQHLAGDAGHLARTTVNSILRDIDGLREHFRKLIEQEARTNARDDASSHSKDLQQESMVARKEFFALLKTFRDILCELARLRLCINEIHLNPSNAAKLLNEHLGTGPAENSSLLPIPSAVGWLGKMLLGGSGSGAPATPGAGGGASGGVAFPGGQGSPSEVGGGHASAASRPGPRPTAGGRIVSGGLGGHLAPRASAAVVSSTLAVEVKGAHASAAEGSRPSTARTQTTSDAGMLRAGPRPQRGRSTTSLTRVQSKNLSGLFAGSLGGALGGGGGGGLGGLSYNNLPQRRPDGGMKPWQRPLSRIVDDDEVSIHRGRAIRNQVFDESSDEDSDGGTGRGGGGSSNLLERTLRPRGLSDSSIRSTFVEHGGATLGVGPVSPVANRTRAPPISRIITPATLSLQADTLETVEAMEGHETPASPTRGSERSGSLTPGSAAGVGGGMASNLLSRSEKVLSFFSGGLVGSGAPLQPSSTSGSGSGSTSSTSINIVGAGEGGVGRTLRQTPSIAALNRAAARGAASPASASTASISVSGSPSTHSSPKTQAYSQTPAQSLQIPTRSGGEGVSKIGLGQSLSASPSAARSFGTSPGGTMISSTATADASVGRGLGLGVPRPGIGGAGF